MGEVEQPAGGDGIAAIEQRLEALEDTVSLLSDEIRTRRLVVLDPETGVERVVAETVRGVPELRLEMPGQRGPGAPLDTRTNGTRGRTAVLLFAVPGEHGLAAGLGLQLWWDGDLVRELSWWSDTADGIASTTEGG